MSKQSEAGPNAGENLELRCAQGNPAKKGMPFVLEEVTSAETRASGRSESMRDDVSVRDTGTPHGRVAEGSTKRRLRPRKAPPS
jgi:hypothetical protein